MKREQSYSPVILEDILLSGVLVFLTILGVAIYLGIFGHFSVSLLTGLAGLTALGWLICWLWRIKRRGFQISRNELIALAVILLIIVITGIFHQEMPRNRDNAGFISAAAALADHGSLAFEDVITRPYHPFRSIDGNTFTSQFLPGYISFLAWPYGLSGLSALQWANALLLGLSSLALYYVFRRLRSGQGSLWPILFYVTLYTTVWFSRGTYSENLFILIMLAGSGLMLKAWQNKTAASSFWSIFIFSFASLVRSEGMIYFLVALIVNLVVVYRFRNSCNWTQLPAWLGTLGSLVVLFFYGQRLGIDYFDYAYRNLTSSLHYFIEPEGAVFIALVIILAAFLLWRRKSYGALSLSVQKKITIATAVIAGLAAIVIWGYVLGQGYIEWRYFKLHYVLDNIVRYGLVTYFILIIIGFYNSQYRIPAILLIIVFAPSFIFFFNPNIAIDQPWFMRRFYGGIIPLLILLGSVAIVHIQSRYRRNITLGLLVIIINISTAAPILFYKEHKGMNIHLNDFTQRFTANDLILMDPGWHWQQWGYNLHYVNGLDILPNADGFTEQELQKLVNQYQRVFVMVERGHQPSAYYPLERLTQVSTWQLQYKELVPTMWTNDYINENKEALSVPLLRSFQRNSPPRVIETRNEDYIIYQVTDTSDLRLSLPST
ncbi:MAG: hypothetical protein V1853_02600 [bacterium]